MHVYVTTRAVRQRGNVVNQSHPIFELCGWLVHLHPFRTTLWGRAVTNKSFFRIDYPRDYPIDLMEMNREFLSSTNFCHGICINEFHPQTSIADRWELPILFIYFLGGVWGCLSCLIWTEHGVIIWRSPRVFTMEKRHAALIIIIFISCIAHHQQCRWGLIKCAPAGLCLCVCVCACVCKVGQSIRLLIRMQEASVRWIPRTKWRSRFNQQKRVCSPFETSSHRSSLPSCPFAVMWPHSVTSTGI